jgi:hypothetical protein
MSTRALSLAWDFPCQTIAEKLILVLLADYADEALSCWPSAQHIAECCGCDERTVRRTLDRLVERRAIEVESRPGRTKRLFLVVDELLRCSDDTRKRRAEIRSSIENRRRTECPEKDGPRTLTPEPRTLTTEPRTEAPRTLTTEPRTLTTEPRTDPGHTPDTPRTDPGQALSDDPDPDPDPEGEEGNTPPPPGNGQAGKTPESETEILERLRRHGARFVDQDRPEWLGLVEAWGFQAVQAAVRTEAHRARCGRESDTRVRAIRQRLTDDAVAQEQAQAAAVRAELAREAEAKDSIAKQEAERREAEYREQAQQAAQDRLTMAKGILDDIRAMEIPDEIFGRWIEPLRNGVEEGVVPPMALLQVRDRLQEIAMKTVPA